MTDLMSGHFALFFVFLKIFLLLKKKKFNLFKSPERESIGLDDEYNGSFMPQVVCDNMKYSR